MHTYRASVKKTVGQSILLMGGGVLYDQSALYETRTCIKVSTWIIRLLEIKMSETVIKFIILLGQNEMKKITVTVWLTNFK